MRVGACVGGEGEGQERQEGNKKEREGFAGMENDQCNFLGTHTVRKYEKEDKVGMMEGWP